MKSSGAPTPPVAEFVPRAQCWRNCVRNAGARWPPGGTADFRVGQYAADRRRGHVVQMVVLFGCAVPIPDVRLVPHFPQPAAQCVGAVAIAQMRGPRRNQSRPLGVILRRIRPARENAGNTGIRKRVSIRFGMNGKRFRHKAHFHQRLDAGIVQSVENFICDRPIVNGISRGVLAVGVGRAPLERGRPVAARQQVVQSHVHRRGAQRSEFAQ